jgi:ketosteroid isomerase-like protein
VSEESTTPGLVELHNRFDEAVNRGDLDAMLGFFAPDAVWETEDGGAVGTFEGRAAIRRFWQDWWASYEELRVEQEEILDLGNGVTFSVVNQKARLVGTSTEIRHRNAVVTVWVDGLAVLVRFFSASSNADIDEARAAAEQLAKERG